MPRRKKGLAVRLQKEKEERERRFQEEEDRQLREIRQFQEEKELQLKEEKERQFQEEKEERELQDKEKARVREEKRLKRKEKWDERKRRKKWANRHAPRVGDRVLSAVSGHRYAAYRVTSSKTGKSISVKKISGGWSSDDYYWEESSDGDYWEEASDWRDEELDDTRTFSWEEAVIEPSLWEVPHLDRPMFICNPFCQHLEKEFPEGTEEELNELIMKTFVVASKNIIYSKKRCRDGKKCQDKRVGHLVNFSHV